ncbi:protein MNN4-like [Cucumis melo var. makuwa]|uniref:Protein MNN4-like n=1 Tax=Cucumis melo var. makuwa TaxID=1194695 RepID=A0A5D3BPK3_CUCMM|nr:protein MNN4-like [Cucumis melo var. makuwa]
MKGAEKNPSDGPISEQRTEERLFKTVVINEVAIQLPEDKRRALRPREKKETKLKEREELLSQVEKVALSVEKGKDKEKAFDEYSEEFEKEIEEFSP